MTRSEVKETLKVAMTKDKGAMGNALVFAVQEIICKERWKNET